jgi:hypothetical protein
MELVSGRPVTAAVLQTEFSFFWLDVLDTSHILRVKVTPQNRSSELQLFVNNTADCPNTAHFSWREVGAGQLTLEVWPGDLQYRIGKYCLGVFGYWEGLNAFEVVTDFIEA